MSLTRSAAVLTEGSAKLVDDFLLAPISDPKPTGQDVRYTGDYDAITEARREDNAALPQGIWLRELKRADWTSVERLCAGTLATRSKDLQVACWLTEAWVHLQGFAGLVNGLALLGDLCERFWPDLYPAPEENDLSARVAPLEWLNDKTPELLRSLPIVSSATDSEERFSWTDYINAQRLETVRQRDAKSADRAEKGGAVTLERFGACQQRTATATLRGTESTLKEALRALAILNTVLQQYCGKEAPGLGAIRSAVEEILGFLAVELSGRQKLGPLASMLRRRTSPSAALGPPSAAAEVGTTPQSPRTREEAYHQLATIAEFLLRTEPHSPTAYLIQRAASWGEMPLPELVQQMSHQGSDIYRLLDVLGLLNVDREIDQNDNLDQ